MINVTWKEIEGTLSLDAISNLEAYQPYLVRKSRTQLLYHFNNGYGASIVTHEYSYGTELAVIEWANGSYEPVYDTGITNDVIGWLGSLEEAAKLLDEIQGLGGD